MKKSAVIFALLYYFCIHLFILPLIIMVILIIAMPTDPTVPYIAQTCSDIIGLFVLLITLLPYIMETFQVFWKNIKFTLLHSVKWYIPQYIFGLLFSILITAFTAYSQPNNQALIEVLAKESLITTIIRTVLIAPVVEEFIFRGIIFRGLRKYGFWKAALVSSLCFGFLHCINSLIAGNFADLIFIVTYASMGFFLCKAYESTKTLFGSIFLHFVNNLIAMSVMIFLL